MPAAATLAATLRYLCSDYASISEVCQRLGINRQQFNKYLSGQTRPTPHNLRRIAEFFGMTEEVLLAPLSEIKQRHLRTKQIATATRASESDGAEQEALRRYCGRYHTYFRSPTYPGYIFKGFVVLYQHDGQTHSKVLDRYVRRFEADAPVSVFRMRGTVTLEGGYLYIHDQRVGRNRSYTMTILYPSSSDEIYHLNGLMLGVASQLDRRPFASNLVYARIPAKMSDREALRACGIFKPDADEIPLSVRPLVENRIGARTDVLVAAPFF
ncbi:MAG TPA: helix-turn-helix transcriptional regulator [Terriglobales bacterium]|nr:helix-turn-helix transcriptional regulator [Terriglobales bacterium]